MTTSDDSYLINHTACECGSSDGKAVYSDGHSYCFVCREYIPGENAVEVVPTKKTAGLIHSIPFLDSKRKLTVDTLNKFRYQQGRLFDEDVHVAPYIIDGTVVAQKIRTRDKGFTLLGDTKNLPLFGQHLWQAGGKRIVITEGEIDCMSVSQAQNNKWPVVSVPNGAPGAKKSLEKHIKYLESFEEIVLCFDMDAPGISAANECINLFTPGKCKIANLPLKDANEMLKADKGPELVSAIWNAKAPTYEGVYTGTEAAALPKMDYTVGYRYPWDTLTEITYGIRDHDMILYIAGTGCGKTDTLKSVAAEQIKQSKRVGLIFLEDPDLQLTLDHVAGKLDGVMYHTPGAQYDQVQYQATRKLVEDHTVLYKPNGDLNVESCLALVRYLAVAHKCDDIFLDHVTYVLDGYPESEQLSAMKKLLKGLNDLRNELDIVIHYVSHLRKEPTGSRSAEEGGRINLNSPAGGKACSQYANTVLALERNQQADTAEDRDISTIRILKHRFMGSAVGQTVHLLYDTKTGLKKEIGMPEDNPFDNPEF